MKGLTKSNIIYFISFLTFFGSIYSQEKSLTFHHTGTGKLPGANQAITDGGLTGTVTYTAGIYTWTVPETRPYKIRVAGASTVANFDAHGINQAKGAIVEGTILLSKDDQYNIIVGQRGLFGKGGSGGSGGSFVWKLVDSNPQPLIIAGGAGGLSFHYGLEKYSPPENGVTNTVSNDGKSLKGYGGRKSLDDRRNASGGGGWNGNGDNGDYLYDDNDSKHTQGGKSPLNGGNGGQGVSNNYNLGNPKPDGGFGGGGGGSYNGHHYEPWRSTVGGGGGGYSGGAGGNINSTLSGHGGASFIDEKFLNVATSDGMYDTNSEFSSYSITNLNSYNDSHGYVIISEALFEDSLTISSTYSVPFNTQSFDLDPKSISDGKISFTTSDSTIATVDSSGRVTINVPAGTVKITATQEASGFYNTSSSTMALTIEKGTPTITTTPLTLTYSDENYDLNLNVTSNSTGEIVYSSSNSQVATISSSIVSVEGAGESIITISQDEDQNYLASTTTLTLTIDKIETEILGFTDISKNVNDLDFDLSVTTSNTSSISYSSSDTSVATISDTTVSIVGVGSTVITLNIPEDSNYLSSTLTATLTVNRIEALLNGLSDIVTDYRNDTVTLSATSSSTGFIRYSSSDENIAIVNGNTVNILRPGRVTITAFQLPDEIYYTPVVNITLTILDNPSLELLDVTKSYGDDDFDLNATSRSTGQVSYSSSDTNVATISGTTVSIVGVGTSIISVHQLESSEYVSSQVTATLTVLKKDPTISGLNPITVTTLQEEVKLNVISESEGEISFSSSDEKVAKISGNSILINGFGETTITAHQESTDIYNSVSKSVILNVTSPNIIVIPKNDLSKSYGNIDPTLNYETSPPGISFSGNLSRISGEDVGTYSITVGTLSNSTTIIHLEPEVFTINKRKIIVDGIKAIDKEYDGTDSVELDTSNVSYSGIIEADDVQVTSISGTFEYVGPGDSKKVIITAVLSGADKGNYTVTPKNVIYGSEHSDEPVDPNFSLALGVESVSYGDEPFFIIPTTLSPGIITYESSDPQIARVNNSTGEVMVVSPGNVTITASISETNYFKGSTKSIELEVKKRTISASGLIAIDREYDESVYVTIDSSKVIYSGYLPGEDINVIITGGELNNPNSGNDKEVSIRYEIEGQRAEYYQVIPDIKLTVNILPSTSLNYSPNLSLSSNMSIEYNSTHTLVPTSLSSGVLRFESSDEEIVSIDSNTGELKALSIGSVSITVNQEAYNYFTSDFESMQVDVVKATSPLRGLESMNKNYGDPAFELNVRSDSDGKITYNSSNPNVAKISGALLTIEGVGETVIAISQEATTNYNASTATAKLIVSKSPTTLSGLSSITKNYGDQSFELSATSSSTGAITYSSSNTNVATINGALVTIVGVGTAVITANQEEDSNYKSTTVTATLTVRKGNPKLSGLDDMSKTYSNNDFSLSGTSSSTGIISYLSSNEEVAKIKESLVTIVGVGTTVITANQSADSNYNSATTSFTLTVVKADPALSIFPIDADYDENTQNQVVLNATSNSSAELTYSISDTSIGSIEGNILTIKAPGEAVITVEQPQSNNYQSATTSTSITVYGMVRKDSHLEWKSSFRETYKPNLTFDISTSSLSDEIVSYSLSDTKVATISGSTLIIKRAGTSVLTAFQEGTQNYKSKTITATVNIYKSNSSLVDFNATKKTYGDAPFSIEAKSMSTGYVRYEVEDSSIATNINGGKEITIIGAGTTRIKAIQKGDQNYNDLVLYAALSVDKAKTVLSAESISAVYGDQSVDVKPTTNSNGKISLESSNTEVATVSGTQLLIRGAGTSKITIAQQATMDYTEATTTINLTVAKRALSISGIKVLDKVYDGTTSATIDLSSLVMEGKLDTDDLSIITVGSYESKKAGANKIVHLSSTISGIHLKNYVVKLQETANASISKKSITVKGMNDSQTTHKVYDGTTSLVVGTQMPYVQVDEFIANDNVSFVGLPVFKSVTAGIQEVLQGSLLFAGSDADNYQMTWQNGSAVIAKKALQVVTKKYIKYVGQDDPVFKEVIYNGLLDSDSEASFLDDLVVKRITEGEDVGVYTKALQASGLVNSNYDITYVNADFEIIPENQLLISIKSTGDVEFGNETTSYDVSASYVSDGVSYTLDVKYNSETGLYSINEETTNGIVAVSFTLNSGLISKNIQYAKGVDPRSYFSRGGNLNSGVYGLQPSNLAIESDFLKDEVSYKGEVNIIPKKVSVSLDAASKQYDGTVSVPVESILINGFIEGDAVELKYLSHYDNQTAGTSKNVMIEGLELIGDDSANYILASNQVSTSNGIITKKALKVKANTLSKVYDGSINSNYSETYTGFIEGEDKTYLNGALVQSGAATTETNVGTYGYSISGYSSDNYNITYESGELTITKAPLSISNVSVLDKTYDGTTTAVVDQSLTVFNGLVSGEEASLSKVTAVFESSQAGVQQVRLSDYSYIGSTLGNYRITDQVTTTATIRRAPLDVVVNSISTSYIGVPYQDFTVGYVGLVNSEDASVFSGELKFSGPGTTAINAGTYQLSASGLINDNYEINYVDGVYTIIESDVDGDGIPDQDDTDIDGDGILNTIDSDINGDGILDNGTDNDLDGVNDANDTDDDNDGWIDTYELECGSDPMDAASILIDTDQDGLPDCIDTDDDNDGVLDVNDAFPWSSYETTDTDGDGIGNNADSDDDNDGQLDVHEISCGSDPLDANSLALDTDSDGIPNCVDTDDDNDGISDVDDAFPLISSEDTDTDGDGIGNNTDLDDDGDGFSDLDEISCGTNPLRIESQPGDLDDDGIADCIDTDMDGDGVDNSLDAFSLNPYESVDTDNDGIGNNADADDDNDGVLDAVDAFPLDASESADVDNDGIGDSADTDLYNDGFDDSRMEVSGALTPNQLGVESTWKITNLNLHPRNKVSVYDKNGVQVFSTENYQNDWRGTFDKTGELLPSGTYYYKVYLYDTQQTLSGWLLLMY